MSAFQNPAGEQRADDFNPFPGLRPFEPDEDYLFFGRERQIDQLLKKLRTTRFLTVVGSSGSGKSSLVRSGLIPALYGGAMVAAGSHWRVAILRPGDDPLGNLAASLAAPEALGALHGDMTRAFFESTLRASGHGLTDCILQAGLKPGINVLVLVDQFEELFRYKRSEPLAGEQATAFTKLLLEAHTGETPCYIALTMRAEFVGQCMEFEGLPEAINEGMHLVPRMSRYELRAAIVGPVAVGRASIAPRLVSRLLNEAGDDPDQLPILQHALMRAWERWRNRRRPAEPLDLRDYDEVGTMRQALSQHAQDVYDDLDPRGRQIAEGLFRTLTEKGPDGQSLRRPSPVSEVAAVTSASAEEVIKVVNAFRERGRTFLMPPPNVALDESSTIDLSHESLMRVWRELKEWVEKEAADGQMYREIAKAAADPKAVWRDPQLQRALDWYAKKRPTKDWAKRYKRADDASFQEALDFLEASRAQRQRDLDEKEERRRRALRTAWLLTGVSLWAVAVTLWAVWKSNGQKQEAVKQAAKAQLQAVQAHRDQLRAEEAETQAKTALAALQKALKDANSAKADAVKQKKRAEQQTSKAEAATRDAVKATNERQAALDLATAQTEEARTQRNLATERGNLATEQGNRATEQRNLATARALALNVPPRSAPPEKAALFALEAYRLNRDSDGQPEDADVFAALRLALERWSPPKQLDTSSYGVRALAVTPDGKSVIDGTDGGDLRRVSLVGANPVTVNLHHPVRSLSVAGDLLAAGLASGEIRIFQLDNGSITETPRKATVGSAVRSVVLQPGGNLLVAMASDGALKLFDVRTMTETRLPELDVKRAAAAAFSGDGRIFAVTIGDRTLLWEAVGGTWKRAGSLQNCAGSDVRSLALSDDGHLAACGKLSGEIALSNVASGSVATLSKHRAAVNSLSFDSWGDFLASGGADAEVYLWNAMRPNTQPRSIPGHKSWVWAVAFTPDGNGIVTAGEDGTVRLSFARSANLAAQLCNKTGDKKLTEDEWKEHLPGVEYQQGSPCAEGRR